VRHKTEKIPGLTLPSGGPARRETHFAYKGLGLLFPVGFCHIPQSIVEYGCDKNRCRRNSAFFPYFVDRLLLWLYPFTSLTEQGAVMKKSVLLNSGISRVVSLMGHFDTLTIGDAGLPVPDGVERIDLAVKLGVPSFIEVFETVMTELCAQKMTIAKEAAEKNKALFDYFTSYCAKNNIQLVCVPHEEFKALSKKSKAVVRTGECKPYANVVIESGVTF
jgi:D-ribose pyranase